MKERNFRAMLEKNWSEGKSVCVGLDSDYNQLPEHIRGAVFGGATAKNPDAQFAFNKRIVDATKDLACVYKLNAAFYEAEGLNGWAALAQTINYIRTAASDVPTILDAKRADINTTNKGYANGAFDVLGADALTVNPYFGGGSLAPFLDYEKGDAGVSKGNKGVIILCRTSNPEAKEFQDRPTLVSTAEFDEELKLLAAAGVTTAKQAGSLAWMDGDMYWVIPHYQWVAIRFAARWNGNGNCALVVGATAPQELAAVRALVGDMPLLLPGVGFQQKGVPLEQQVKQAVDAGKDSRGAGFIINSSRGIIFASKGEDFAAAARRETEKLADQIRLALSGSTVPAGQASPR